MSNALYKVGIERDKLYKRVGILADQMLITISADSVNRFADASKKLVERAFDSAILSINDSISKGNSNYDKDTVFLLKFTDIRKGYRQQMRDWVEHNPFSTDLSVAVEESPSISLFNRKSFRWFVLSIIGGSILIWGLFLLTDYNWLWWLEFLVLFLAILGGHKGIILDKNCERQMKKRSILDTTIKEMDKWLDEAEKHSFNVLRSFGINN